VVHGVERVGAVVRTVRAQRGWSIRELAERAGVSPVQLSRVERLKASPTEETIRALAAALDVPVATLFAAEPLSASAAIVAMPSAFSNGLRQLLVETGVPPGKLQEAELLIVATARAICASLQEGTADAAVNHSERDHR
jgi:transcriptional regulator with XRE-family HTH domain